MENRRIDDVVRSDLRTFTSLGIPPPEAGKRWQRFDCPYCGKADAAISYEAGVFWCPHKKTCGKRITERRSSEESELKSRALAVLDRFRPQINQAVRNIASHYGKWFSPASGNRRVAVSVAQDFILGYAGENFGPNDAGMLDEWDATWLGDPEKVDQYVLAALNGDMANWAKSWIEKKRSEAPEDMADYSADITSSSRSVGAGDALNSAGVTRPQTAAPTQKDAEHTGDLAGYPLLAQQFGEYRKLTAVEMARIHKVTEKTMRARLNAETARYLADHAAETARYLADAA